MYMSLNKSILRDFIIKTFMGPQAPKNTQKADSELDSFIEAPKTDVPKSDEIIVTKTEESTSDITAPTKKRYKYLDHDVLSREFSFDREQTLLEKKPHKLALCLFMINEHTKSPFLEFLFQKINGTYKFPEADVNMDVFTDIINKTPPTIKINIEDTDAPVQTEAEGAVDDDTNEIDIEFFNQCSQLFQKTTSLGNDIASQRYLGFVEKEELIYIFFNCSNLDIIHLETGLYEFGIIDEIINKKKISDIVIEQRIVDLFSDSPLITHIYREQGAEIPYPKVVFLCELTENGEYKNAYYSGSQKTMSIINPKIDNVFFGTVYVFSSEPIISGPTTGIVQGIVKTMTNTTDLIKRYAFFTDSAKIYKEAEVDTNGTADKRFISYGFMDKGRELWAAKTTSLFTEI